MTNKFLKVEADGDLNPVDYFNMHKDWKDAFNEKDHPIKFLTSTSIAIGLAKVPFIEIKDGMAYIIAENSLKLPIGKSYTKFMLMSRVLYKGNHLAAWNYVAYKWLNANVPYIRVGTDYFFVFNKVDRYGISRKVIKAWKKEEIKADHPGEYKWISKYDDFCIVPNNKSYRLMVDNCYNLYSEFSHTELSRKVTESDFPISMILMRHIFGDQIEMGLTYLQVLYCHPMQPLPILCLVSKLRQTGKTTFLNWMQIIFGDNFIQINPEDLSSQFNSSYASKNIIAIDETVIEKSHAVEKLKSIATTKSISVNQKFVANYALPFYGKVILCTNKEIDFMRIDQEEIRFWIRKVNSINSINTGIENQLKSEIPAFLKYLSQLPAVDFTKSRMVFTADQLSNEQLNHIKMESQSGLRKELFMYFEDFFIKNSGLKEIKASAIDIKAKWFERNPQVSSVYILKVLRDEMGLVQGKNQRYSAFDNDPASKSPGRPFTFLQSDYVKVTEKIEVADEIPF